MAKPVAVERAALRLAGSDIGFQIPGLGMFYPPNLTGDTETGLGHWSEDDIVRALRQGERPDGRQQAPIMPWMAYAGLEDDDALSVAAYLNSLPPVAYQAPGPFGESETPGAPYLSVVLTK